MTSRTRTCVLALTAMLLAAPVTAAPQQAEARRLKAIEAFERLLGETIHEFVSDAVRVFVETNHTVSVQDQPDVGVVVAQPLVRVGAPTTAHGVYVDGYGVIFSIQRPPVAVIPQAFERRLADPWTVLRLPDSDGPADGRFMALSVIDFRTRQIVDSLSELEVLLERSIDQGAEQAVIDNQKQQVEQMRRALQAMREADEQRRADSEGNVTIILEEKAEAARTRAEGERRAGSARARTRWSEYESAIDLQRSVSEILRANEDNIDRAVNNAAVETLSQFGGVINWLDDDERISVLVYAPQVHFARPLQKAPGGDEYIISVRYKDIREYTDGKLDADKFRARVKVHDRVGTAIPFVRDQD